MAFITADICRLVKESGDLRRAGVCCINIHDTAADKNIDAIFEAREELIDLGGFYAYN